MITVSLPVRLANPNDQQQIANLMFFESHVHRHLDWRTPLDWLGEPNFWVLEENERVVGTLACPQDATHVAWVRLFAHAHRVPLTEAWNALWETAKTELALRGGGTVAVIVLHEWMETVLKQAGFIISQQIIMLEWRPGDLPNFSLPADVTLRTMTPEDLPAVSKLDSLAFDPLWQNPLDALESALPQANFATVLEDAQGLAGYQISTENLLGVHLARLAIRPDAQGQGLGAALVADLLRRTDKLMVRRVTVNTQSDNQVSLALYSKIGFAETGERYSVYRFDVSPQI